MSPLRRRRRGDRLLNSTYVAEAVAHLRSGGEAVPNDLLVHTSPVGWQDIAFSGDFFGIGPQGRLAENR